MDASLDSWEGIAENYLKADNFPYTNGSFVVNDVKLGEQDGKAQITLVTFVDNQKFIFPLNYTNTKKVRQLVQKPKDLIGLKLKWEKIRVMNPSTQQMQDSISLTGVD